MGGTLEGKVALVSGAARGIGAATVRYLCRLGARVAVTDQDADAAHGLAAELRDEGYDAVGLACDVSDADAVAGAVASTVRQFGGLDLLDHNAAWTDFRTDLGAEDVDLATWERVLSTNTTGGLLLIRAGAAPAPGPRRRIHRPGVVGVGVDRGAPSGGLRGVQGGARAADPSCRDPVRARRDPLQRGGARIHPHRLFRAAACRRRGGSDWPPRTRSGDWAPPRTSPTSSASSCPTVPGS